MAEIEKAAEEKESAASVSATLWHDRIKEYRRIVDDKWEKQRNNLDKLYSRDERADSADREYAIFWANIEVLKPATYAKTPQPVVAPRFKQPNPIASAASDTLERCLITTYEQSDLDGCLREVRDEFLRYARGTGWVRLYAKPDGSPCTEFDHVTAEDFAHEPARTWREVNWVAKRVWLTREKGEERFGEIFEQVPLKRQDKNSAVDNPMDKAPVWEGWDKLTGMVVWFAEDFDTLLDSKPPWLNLTSFWPCPKPAFGTLVPNKLRPVPDIRQYKDQIEEINEYTARIAALSEKLRLQGFYPAGQGEISDAIETALKSLDNRATLIPVSNWAAFGGVAPKDMIVWLPIKECLELVKGLVELRRVVIDDVYQITGISDIVRGQTEASETATAQQIKSQWGSLRIRDRQNEISRFARDMTRIAAEIISENYPADVVHEMSQTELMTAAEKQQAQQKMQQFQAATQMAQQQGMQPPQPPMSPEQMQQLQTRMQKPSFDEVMQFLQNDRARGFTIEIETDSTIQPDEDADKNRRVEFVTAIGGLFQQAAPIVMQAPQLGPFMGEVLKFAAQGFRAGRPLEGAIDQLTAMLEQMAQKAMQPQPPQPDPKLEVEKLKAQTAAKTAEADITMKRMDVHAAETEHAMDMQKMAMEGQRDQQSHVLSMAEMRAKAAQPKPGAQ